ncbi:SGNH hydrolase [Longispora fulva]|uniref:Lysophospholipase L1-like esterase n=1 Tax=Longispora fulva TaxID=619741 RepID=A0A8J7GIX8_9ACTN|nr:SGNH/GDSL hydrolase family protein [Longispora fulva]MBG6137450.1 lysophospholipase L1-like esterase [Longispora fulva]GIG61195.1 SGNH hydrolase [Longispora fulva]
MNTPRKLRVLLAATAVAVVASSVLAASSGSATGGIEKTQEWTGTWAAGSTPGSVAGGSSQIGFTNQSLRMIVHTSVGGEALRIRISDQYGLNPSITIGHATIALPDLTTPDPSDIDLTSVHELTFNGKTSVVQKKGTDLLTDPVTMTIPNQQDLVVTLFFPVATGPTTFHFQSRQASYYMVGDQTTTAAMPGASVRENFYFLAGIDVLREKAGGSVAILGDSIANGTNSTMGGNKRWPDALATRLILNPRNGRTPGVLNMGVSGNRITKDGLEPINGGGGFAEIGNSALFRLGHDVLAPSGVGTVVVDLGINDIWMSNESADAIIDGLHQISVQSRQRAIKVIGCTLMPYETSTAAVWTPEREATRIAVNEYLRTSSDFDGVVDFDKALRDPAAPTKLRAEFDSGDHIHPNDAGYQLMADTVNLNMLR